MRILPVSSPTSKKRNAFKLLLSLTLFGVLALLPWRLQAAPVSQFEGMLGTKPVAFALPSGQCRADPANASDKALMQHISKSIAGSYHLLGLTMTCDALENIRKGRFPGFSRSVQYQSAVSTKDVDLPVTTQQFASWACKDEAANVFDPNKVSKAVAAKVDAGLEAMPVNTNQYLGALPARLDGCYASFVRKIMGPDGKPRLLATVFASTLVKQRPLVVQMSDIYEGMPTVASLSKDVSDLLVNLHKLNPAN